MSVELMAQVWKYSPYEGQMLLLHMALADAVVPSMAGLEAVVELDNLRDKARFRRVDALIEQLENMESDGHLEGVTFKHEGQSWATVGYELNFDHLYKSHEQRRIEHLEGQCELYQSQIKDPNPVQGYVYVIKCGEYYKIGRTTSLDRRIEQLAIQLPHKPEIIHTVATATPHTLEQWFHRHFSDKRLNGEWFALNNEDIDQFSQWVRMDRGEHGITKQLTD